MKKGVIKMLIHFIRTDTKKVVKSKTILEVDNWATLRGLMNEEAIALSLALNTKVTWYIA